MIKKVEYAESDNITYNTRREDDIDIFTIEHGALSDEYIVVANMIIPVYTIEYTNKSYFNNSFDLYELITKYILTDNGKRNMYCSNIKYDVIGFPAINFPISTEIEFSELKKLIYDIQKIIKIPYNAVATPLTPDELQHFKQDGGDKFKYLKYKQKCHDLLFYKKIDN